MAGDLGASLTRKLGPLPVWAWGAIGGGTLYLYNRHKGTATLSTSNQGTGLQTGSNGDPLLTGASGGGSGSPLDNMTADQLAQLGLAAQDLTSQIRGAAFAVGQLGANVNGSGQGSTTTATTDQTSASANPYGTQLGATARNVIPADLPVGYSVEPVPGTNVLAVKTANGMPAGAALDGKFFATDTAGQPGSILAGPALPPKATPAPNGTAGTTSTPTGAATAKKAATAAETKQPAKPQTAYSTPAYRSLAGKV